MLQKKGIKFQWTTKCATSFDKLKNMLMHAPILRIENSKNYFQFIQILLREVSVDSSSKT